MDFFLLRFKMKNISKKNKMFYNLIFCGLQTFSSFLTLAPHLAQVYFGFSRSSNSFSLQAFLLIVIHSSRDD